MNCARGTYTFSHDLIRDALYREIPEPIRRLQHRRVAQVLERLHTVRDSAVVSQLARHWDSAGDAGRASQYYAEVGRRALAIFALDEAQSALQRALELVGDARLRFETLMLLEGIASLRGARQEQHELLDAAEQTLALLGPEERCPWLRRRIDLANSLSRHDAASHDIEELRTLADRHGLRQWVASALEADAKRLRSLNRFDEEERRFNELTALLDKDSERFASAFLAHADTLIYQGRLTEARSFLDRVRATLNKDEQRREFASVLMALSRAALVQQDYASMADYAWQAHAVSVGDRRS